ncbi:LysR substrate-binding domain-containing protein [Paraburkholderia sp. DHOC27]|uniref:LysR substrate-binding domain-containing protein n=1 Tax=Paraburkholderia sp. DHOC27 TaxID=2303330 RepID=UPI000E3EA7B9|nr:LysR substrate-binding domain-containing protein [Paraburkholderia sp. DHOC27]RFU44899.1 LysR family transcriptional regulator [Paraburkholderia sp. DHOC27]
MVSRTNLDMDVLRTFVTGFELGSFARAADRLGRSQSAVSTQLRKLEEQVGLPLVQKSGRGLALTTAGEGLLGYAKRLLELNDEAVDTIRGSDLEGWVRLGLPQDFADTFLPAVLGRFSRAHPKVRVEVQVDRSVPLVEKTRKGELDMALVWGESGTTPHAERIGEFSISWIGRPDWNGKISAGSEPLPLVAFDPPCSFRAAGIAALDAHGIPWRQVFTSPSLSGLWAAAEAGLGITVRTTNCMPANLIALDPAANGLPALPLVTLSLYRAEAESRSAVKRLTDIVLHTIKEETTQPYAESPLAD